jgi:transposase
MTINRHLRSPFWTREKDALLRKLKHAGSSTKKIAAKLGVTPSSVKRRSLYLQGHPNPSDWQREELRAKARNLREQKKLRIKGVLAAMRTEIARGAHRDAAIMKALRRGAGARAIAKELGVSHLLVYRTIWQGATEQELRAMGERRKKAEGRAAAALIEMRAALGKGLPRDAAILQARKVGVTYAAIGKEAGLTRQRVHQIILQHEALARQ